MYKSENITILENNDLRITLSNLGARIVKFELKKANDQYKNLVFSPDMDTEAARGTLAGFTLGPCAGRIFNGELCLHDKTYQLTKNEGRHHIHGGLHNVSTIYWHCIDQSVSRKKVIYSCFLPDGLDGYPGNRHCFVTYKLTNNKLTIQYHATTDQTTYLCLSNHTYWNFNNDFSKPCTDMILQIPSTKVFYNTNEHIPDGLINVQNTVFDFYSGQKLSFVDLDFIFSKDFMAESSQKPNKMLASITQLQNARGYNNAFIFDSPKSPIIHAILTSADQKLQMVMKSDYPALVVYSGGYIDHHCTVDHKPCSPACAIALEASDCPDGLHRSEVNTSLLTPENPLEHSISFEIIKHYKG